MLTRDQELFLIQIGIDTLVNAHNGNTKKKHGRAGMAPWNKGIKTGPRKTRKGHNGHKWTDAQREKFRATMKAKWEKKRRKQ